MLVSLLEFVERNSNENQHVRIFQPPRAFLSQLNQFFADEEKKMIEWLKFVTVPLYSIRCVGDAVKLLDQVRKSKSR
jgi:hypothetical protein